MKKHENDQNGVFLENELRIILSDLRLKTNKQFPNMLRPPSYTFLIKWIACYEFMSSWNEFSQLEPTLNKKTGPSACEIYFFSKLLCD